MNVRRIITFAFVLVAITAMAVGLSSCDSMQTMIPDAETPPMEEMPPMAEGINIGVALAETGEFAEPYGIPMRRGLDLAKEEINMLGGPSITFVSADPESTIEGAKAAIQQLVDQEVPAIIGIGISTHLEQAFPIAQDAGVIAFSPISSGLDANGVGLSSLGDYIFRTGLTVGVLNSNGTMVTHAKLDYKKAALIYDAKDTYATSSNAAFEKTLTELGVDILTVETFEKGDTDFSTQLTNIMGMEPDALFISALSGEMTQIITAAKSMGVSAQLIIPDLTVQEIQEVGDAAEGAITFSGWFGMAATPGNHTFVEKYKAKHGSEPGPWAAQAYATLHILADAITKAQSTDAAAIREALAKTMDLPTILGNFSFDPNGEAVYDPIVFMVKNGELQLFE